MTKKSVDPLIEKLAVPVPPDMTKDEIKQVLKDEAAAEVAYQAEVADDELSILPACTQEVVKAQKECQ